MLDQSALQLDMPASQQQLENRMQSDNGARDLELMDTISEASSAESAMSSIAAASDSAKVLVAKGTFSRKYAKYT